MGAASYTLAGMPGGERAGGTRARLVEVLIGAVCAGGRRLARVRSEFEGMDPAASLRRLVLQAVDPELLAVVVGSELAPAWVVPLRAQYRRFQQAYPADWVDVEKVWREQRVRWRRSGSSAGSGSSGAVARAYPERASPGEASGRAAPSRAVTPRRAARPASAPVSGRPAAPVHRPTPAGVPAVHGPDEEPLAAAPDAVLDGMVDEMVDETADAGAGQQGVREERSAREAAGGGRPPPPLPSPRSAVVNGVPVEPAVSPGRAGSGQPVRARVPRSGSSSAAGDRIVAPGAAGDLLERLARAMLDSRASVESVRRVWIDADGAAGGWDLWALDPAVLDRVRALFPARAR